MTRTQWYIPEDLKLEAEMEAKLQSVPVSEIFRQALKAYLDEQRKLRLKTRKDPFAKVIGSIKGIRFTTDDDPSSLSKEIDRLIYEEPFENIK
jgi:metal-responsive CopG/Arc/MetJ family transcriptional regulator